jgi:ubiquitin carboxyl-terminal hydrolase L3
MFVNWLPLESNPDTLNDYLIKLGFDITQFSFVDLFSTEDWAKEMIPQPVIGVLLVFPYTEKHKAYRDQEDQEIKVKGQVVNPNLFFMKQKASNACGSVGIFHLLTNLCTEQETLLSSESLVTKFKNSSLNLSFDERAEKFNECEEILNLHKQIVQQGVSEVCEEVDNHFVALTNFSGHLYELDGTKSTAVNHGETSNENFLNDACGVIKKFMDREPESISFSIVVLAKS